MSFTERFAAATLENKPNMAMEERNNRVQNDLDKYVTIPVALPLFGRVSPEPYDFKLGWAIGVPGAQDDGSGKPARAALTLGFPDEDTAEDFCYLLNQARANRTAVLIGM